MLCPPGKEIQSVFFYSSNFDLKCPEKRMLWRDSRLKRVCVFHSKDITMCRKRSQAMVLCKSVNECCLFSFIVLLILCLVDVLWRDEGRGVCPVKIYLAGDSLLWR